MKALLLKLTCIVLSLMAILYFKGRDLKFNTDFARVVYAEERIIGATVSSDQQWRIRCEGDVPDKLATSIRLFEDEYFHYHPGVNPFSLFKALVANIRAHSVVRGGSTITMQLARIYLGNKPRTYSQKLVEIFYAFAIEVRYSKSEILELYAQYAPFGGNTVGYCAAAYRYYGTAPADLSWAQAATLAVLPNAPSAIYPGKGREELMIKRDDLLLKLMDKGYIDTMTWRLSTRESLPGEALPFESLSPHLVQSSHWSEADISNSYSTLDHSLQKHTLRLADSYYQRYKREGISNLAILVLNNTSGNVAAYIANSPCKVPECGGDVDVILSKRSPGSTLKPFLYAMCIQTGMIAPQSLLEDIPVYYNGYSPQNFDETFRGIVPADHALTQSLNVPAVGLLSGYGVGPFLHDLQEAGFTTLDKGSYHYGLSIILGGGEVTPLELGQAYMNLARSAMGLGAIKVRIDRNDALGKDKDLGFPVAPGAAWLTLETLKGLHRPESRSGWELFESRHDISWKTGTSYGYRDAWSVGVTAAYTVVVWVGNADGSGAGDLTGIRKAAPLMFSVFDLLPRSESIAQPFRHLKMTDVCSRSGMAASRVCDDRTLQYVPVESSYLPVCCYHSMERMTADGGHRITYTLNADMEATLQPVFSVSPEVNCYYRKSTGIDLSLPPMLEAAENSVSDDVVILYPTPKAKIVRARDLSGELQPVVLTALLPGEAGSLFWFINDDIAGRTEGDHKLALDLSPGEHHIVAVSTSGGRAERWCEVVAE